jgi:hypothetical protein
MPKLSFRLPFSGLSFSGPSAWTPPGPTARQRTAQPGSEPADGLVFDDPAYESFFAEYRQGRCEPPNRAAR